MALFSLGALATFEVEASGAGGGISSEADLGFGAKSSSLEVSRLRLSFDFGIRDPSVDLNTRFCNLRTFQVVTGCPTKLGFRKIYSDRAATSHDTFLRLRGGTSLGSGLFFKTSAELFSGLGPGSKALIELFWVKILTGNLRKIIEPK